MLDWSITIMYLFTYNRLYSVVVSTLAFRSEIASSKPVFGHFLISKRLKFTSLNS